MSDAEKVAAFDAIADALTNRWRDGTWSWWCPYPCGGDHPRWRQEDADAEAERKPPTDLDTGSGNHYSTLTGQRSVSIAPVPRRTRMETPVIRCIKCGVGTDEQRIGVQVDTGLIHCGGCDEEYTAADVRAFLTGWERLIAWVEAFPAAK